MTRPFSLTFARSAARLGASIAAALLVAACDTTNPQPRVPARLDIVAGDDQEARVGTELPNALVVKVTDSRGRPVRGQIVNFRVVSGGGSVFAGTAETNEDGEARERWTLGTSTAPADSQRVEARAVDAATGAALVFATFSAVARPDVPAGVAAVGAATRTGAAGSVVADSLAVRVADRYNNPVPNVEVAWTASGNGTVSPATSRTDAAGVAKARWTLGGSAGAQTAVGTVAGVGAVTFTATVGAAGATRVTILPRELRFATLGRQAQVTVSAIDAFGNPITAPATLISRNAAVASLEGTNTVQARGNGSTHLVATVQGVSDSIVVTVQQLAVTVSVTPSQAQLLLGDTLRFRATAADSGGAAIANPQVTWRTSNAAVVTVNSAGLATAVGGGSGTITASLGTAEASSTVTVVVPLVATALDAGGHHNCAVAPNGTTYCWGANSTRQLGRTGGASVDPTPVSGAPRFTAISASLGGIAGAFAVGHSCGLTSGGAVYCWGNNINRQLAGPINTTTERCRLSNSYEYWCRETPEAVAGVSQAIAVTTGALHTCALTADGSAFCWGSNARGELGTTEPMDGSVCRVEGPSGTVIPCTATPVRVAGGLSFKQITAGESFTCALTQDGAAYCWGKNTSGELGNPQPSASTPVPVQGGHRFSMISTGGSHTCGVRTDGEILCWGAGGALGNGGSTASNVPVRVSGNQTYQSVSSGRQHTCAIATSGEAFCWGRGDTGQLGTGGLSDRGPIPGAVSGGLRFSSVASGAFHSCGTEAQSGIVYCWGARAGTAGEPGVGIDPAPVRVTLR